ncbi:MAG: response regulator transcription factor [Ruminococcaceae bacterium]|nr:response regulator transcription factor [Oscillospiraceae bacterium]
MNILIVEDDLILAETICEIFKSQKYICDVVHNGKDGCEYASSGIYDVIVLDIMLPQMDGFEVTRRLRSSHIKTPIILLTARDEVSDKVKGLDCGADDYLTKPFSKDELLARVRAMTRRTGDIIIDKISYGNLILDLNTYTLQCNNRSMRIGHKEFEILKLLISNPQQVFSKEDLITKIWGYLSEAEDNNVEVYVSFIRKKLNSLNSNVTISTVRKIGYHLNLKEE